MKLRSIVFALLFICYSCNTDTEKASDNEFQGKWILVKMSGNMINSETTGQNMGWQETYTFNQNGTFSKSRKQNGTIIESSGSFSVLKSEEGINLELIHTSKSDIIGSCLGEKKEVLYLQSPTIMTSTWNQCDGPGLEYKKSN